MHQLYNQKMNRALRCILSRFLIAIVAFWNILAGLTFFLAPSKFAVSYELSGIPGNTAVQAVGLLFIMWTVPYLFTIVDPCKYKILLASIITAQAIGVLGELLVISQIPATNHTLRISSQRFLIFDSIGLILLLGAAFLARFKIDQIRGI